MCEWKCYTGIWYRIGVLICKVGDRVQVNNVSGTIVGVTPQGNLRVSMESADIKALKTQEFYVEPGTISLGYRESSVNF